MAKQTDFTPEEWKALSAAPLMAGLAEKTALGELKSALGVKA